MSGNHISTVQTKLENNIDLKRAECSLKRAMNRIEITK